jgi:hypothetical protein
VWCCCHFSFPPIFPHSYCWLFDIDQQNTQIASCLRDVLGGGSDGQALKAKASAFADSVKGTDPAADAARLVIKETQSAAQASGKNKFALYPKEVSLNFSTASTSTAVPEHFKLKHDAATYR